MTLDGDQSIASATSFCVKSASARKRLSSRSNRRCSAIGSSNVAIPTVSILSGAAGGQLVLEAPPQERSTQPQPDLSDQPWAYCLYATSQRGSYQSASVRLACLRSSEQLSPFS